LDYFTYQPQFKLVIAGNHRPALRHVDQAIRRRFHLLPFTAKVEGEQTNPQLPEQLREEWPGILQWMIEGCLQYQKSGLRPPSIVLEATNEYLDAEDSIAVWIADCCVTATGLHSTAAALYASWENHERGCGDRPGTKKHFSQRLVARGFRPKRQGGTGAAGFEGIAVKQEGLFAANNHSYLA
jgi:putative DNA primase/helicase